MAVLEAEVMTTFHLGLAEVEALTDERFIDLAGRALYMRQRQWEALEAVVANGVSRAFRGRRK